MSKHRAQSPVDVPFDDNPVVQLTMDAVAEWVEEQPWFRKYANTFVSIVSGLMTLAWWIVGTGIDIPHWATIVIGVVFFIASAFGIKKTRNGMTPTTQAELVDRVRKRSES